MFSGSQAILDWRQIAKSLVEGRLVPGCRLVLINYVRREYLPSTFIDGIAKLGVTTVPELLGARYIELAGEIDRIRKYRNKLIHGLHLSSVAMNFSLPARQAITI